MLLGRIIIEQVHRIVGLVDLIIYKFKGYV